MKTRNIRLTIFKILPLFMVILMVSCHSQEEASYEDRGESRPVEQSSGQSRPARNEESGKANELDETETMIMRLNDFIRFETIIPAMALTQEQKDGIVPILEEWKEVYDSKLQPDNMVFIERIAAVLTKSQNDYTPVPQEQGQSGPPSGGQGGGQGGRGGQSGPPPGQDGQSGQGDSSQGGPGGEMTEAQKLEMLIRALSGEQGDPMMMGPPAMNN
ncbi:MAG: hypothetical protein PQJ59_00940 [Spirochaetales bacterium]|nr:hypothetical protein [Spirochaetales bacterium]